MFPVDKLTALYSLKVVSTMTLSSEEPLPDSERFDIFGSANRYLYTLLRIFLMSLSCAIHTQIGPLLFHRQLLLSKNRHLPALFQYKY